MASEQPHPNARQYVESLAATGRCHFDSAEGQALVGVSTDAARAAVNRPPLPEGPYSVRDYLTPAALLVLSLMAAAVVVRVVATTHYPYPIDNGEGVILGAAGR